MGKRKDPQPEPVVVNTVCSLCGEPWHLHAETDGEVTTLECIRLLKAKAVRPVWIWNQQRGYTWPYTTPQWTYTVSGAAGQVVNNCVTTASNTTPRVLNTSVA